MGCKMLAIVDTDDPCPGLQNLPVDFDRWEQVLSRFRSDSELCDLNRTAGNPVVVSQILWDVFQAAAEAEVETRGLVNPLIADALIHAGYDRDFAELQSSPPGLFPVLDAPAVPALTDVIADPRARSLHLPTGSRLDFGGVAKGWAAQQAMLGLSKYGSSLVSAGGDIAVSGLRGDGEPWKIGIDDPFHAGEYLEFIYLETGAVATSGKDYHNWMRGGVSQHHIIDPRSGLPAETDVLTATVIAPDAVLAEAFAKAALISGSQGGMAWLDSDERLAGLLVLENGQRLYSRGLQAYL